MADIHGISVSSLLLCTISVLYLMDIPKMPLTSSVTLDFRGASPTNRIPSRDATRLQLVAMSECLGRRLPPNAMRSCAFDSLHYLSSFITGYLQGSGPPCPIGTLTTRVRVSCGPASKTTLGCGFHLTTLFRLIKHPRSSLDPLPSQGSPPFLAFFPSFHPSIPPPLDPLLPALLPSHPATGPP
jgi:hypothetical protein